MPHATGAKELHELSMDRGPVSEGCVLSERWSGGADRQRVQVGKVHSLTER